MNLNDDDDIRPEQDEILEDELIKTKLEPKVSTDDNDVDDKDMTSEKDMVPYDTIQKMMKHTAVRMRMKKISPMKRITSASLPQKIKLNILHRKINLC